MAGVRDVKIVLHSARDVRKPTFFAKVYPIAVLTLPGVSEQTFQTKRPVKADDDPAWQEAFVFKVPAEAIKPQSVVRIQVFGDVDRQWYCGQVEVPLTGVTQNTVLTFPLKDSKGERGHIKLSLTIKDPNAPPPQPKAPKPAAGYNHPPPYGYPPAPHGAPNPYPYAPPPHGAPQPGYAAAGPSGHPPAGYPPAGYPPAGYPPAAYGYGHPPAAQGYHQQPTTVVVTGGGHHHHHGKHKYKHKGGWGRKGGFGKGGGGGLLMGMAAGFVAGAVLDDIFD